MPRLLSAPFCAGFCEAGAERKATTPRRVP